MIQSALTTKEISSLLGSTMRSTQRRANKEGWKSLVDNPNSPGNKWVVSSMPEATRAVILAAEAAKAKAQGAAGKPADIPVWAFDLGKLRAQLVFEWRAHVAKAKPKGINKTKASEDFLGLVQAGKFLTEEELQLLGAYSLKSIYRWDKQLRENGDQVDILADKRGKWTKGGAKGLGQIGQEAEILALEAWLSPNRPSMTLAYHAVASVLERRGKPVPSYNSVRRFLLRFSEQNKDLVLLKREGKKALVDKMGPYIARNDKILAVGDVLFADGHRLNFDAIHPATGKPVRMILIVWFDWRSRMPVGWEIMPEENTIAIMSALHMAIQNLGKYPQVAYIDNGKAFKSEFFTKVDDRGFRSNDGLYIRIGIDVQYSKPYAAQTKIIERFWGTFNEQCARLLPCYRGNSIDDKPAYLRRDEKYHKARHNGWVPTIHEVARIFQAYVGWYAQNPHRGLNDQCPGDIFKQGCGPGVNVAELDRHFLLRKIFRPYRTGFTISGIRFESDALYGLDKDILATYKWSDLSEINLYDPKSGRYIGTARPTEALNPLARVFGDELDMLKVAEANKRQQRLRKTTFDLAKQLDGQGDVLNSLPWMRPAAERRASLSYIKGGKKDPETPEIPTLTEEEAAELRALNEKFIAEQKSAPAYEKPDYFGTEGERYEYLFDLIYMEKIQLTEEDAAWMQAFEESPAYKPIAGRFEQLKEFFRQQNQEASEK